MWISLWMKAVDGAGSADQDWAGSVDKVVDCSAAAGDEKEDFNGDCSIEDYEDGDGISTDCGSNRYEEIPIVGYSTLDFVDEVLQTEEWTMNVVGVVKCSEYITGEDWSKLHGMREEYSLLNMVKILSC